MGRFGQYETDRPLYRTGFSTIYLWRPGTKGTGPRVIKAHESAVRAQDARLAAAESAAFLDSAAVQQKAASEGTRYWAPIHEIGTSPEGAFYVTDYYELSAQQLIDGRVNIGAAGLYHIVKSVTGGLLALKRACGRPHGNLKFTNILIAPRQLLTREKVVLCDPCPGSLLDEDTHAKADLAQLGVLIHQLVTHRTPALVAGYQVPDSPDWRRLGRRADAWRDLCNRLLTIDAQAEPLTLEEVAARLPRIARRGRTLAIKTAACVAAVVLLAVLSRLTAGWISDFLAPPDPNLVLRATAAYPECQKAAKWLGPLTRDLRMEVPGINERRYDYWGGKDPSLAKLAEWALQTYERRFLANKKRTDTNTPPDGFETDKRFLQCVIDANEAREKIERLLSNGDAGWPVPKELLNRAAGLRAHGCPSMADYLSALVHSVWDHNGQLAQHIDDVFYIHTNWGDPDPVQYEKLVLRAVANDPNLNLRSVADASAGDFVKGLKALPNHYEQEIREYHDLIRAEGRLRKKLEDVNDSGDTEAKVRLAELDESIEQRGKQIGSPPFTRADEVRVVSECNAFRARIREIERKIRNAGEWFDYWQKEAEDTSTIGSSAALKEAFLKRLHNDKDIGSNRDAFIRDCNDQWGKLGELRDRVERWRGSLLSLNTRLAKTLVVEPPSTPWVQSISQYYEKEKRDSLINTVTEKLAQVEPLPDPNDYPPDCKEQLAWPSRAVALIKDFADIERGLEHFYLLDETPPGARANIGFLYTDNSHMLDEMPSEDQESGSVARALAPITHRLAELMRVQYAISNTDLLLSEAKDPQFGAGYDVSQARYAIWRKLVLQELKKDKWQEEENIRSQLLVELEARQRDGRLPKARWEVLDRQIRTTGEARERRFWNIRTGDLAALVADKARNTGVAPLLRLGDFKPPDSAELSNVKDYHACLKSLLDNDVNSADWPARYDLEQFGKDFPLRADADTVVKQLSEMRFYRRVEDPRDEAAWKDSRDELDERINEGKRTMADNKDVQDQLNAATSLVAGLDRNFDEIRSLAAIEKHKEEIGKWDDLLGELRKEQQQVNSIVHPAYRHLTFRRDGSATFRPGLGLDQFEPIDPSLAPLTPDLKDEFFTSVDRRDRENAGWPTYIRASKDRRVVLRFVPKEKDSDPPPFYMAICETTSAQFVKFLATLGRPEDRLRCLRDAGRNAFYYSGIDLTNAWISAKVLIGGKYLDNMGDRPVDWVTYTGAQAYADWLTETRGQGLPKASWHERAATYSHPPNQAGSYENPNLYHIQTQQYWNLMQTWKDSQPKEDRVNITDWIEAVETAQKAAASGISEPVGAVREESGDPPRLLANGIYTDVYPMASKELPELKLYDLLGNVWEWSQDSSGRQVICGGSCLSPLKYIHPSAKYDRPSGDPACDLGFRVAIQCRPWNPSP
jgi:formylglycine-generating enzyme required for sulfatase activity